VTTRQAKPFTSATDLVQIFKTVIVFRTTNRRPLSQSFLLARDGW